jgi:hypothetical protein
VCYVDHDSILVASPDAARALFTNCLEQVFSEVRKRACLVTAVSWYTDYS